MGNVCPFPAYKTLTRFLQQATKSLPVPRYGTGHGASRASPATVATLPRCVWMSMQRSAFSSGVKPFGPPTFVTQDPLIGHMASLQSNSTLGFLYLNGRCGGLYQSCNCIGVEGPSGSAIRPLIPSLRQHDPRPKAWLFPGQNPVNREPAQAQPRLPERSSRSIP